MESKNTDTNKVAPFIMSRRANSKPSYLNYLNDDHSSDDSSYLPSELGDVDERELESSVGSMTEDQGLHNTSDDAILPPEYMGRGSTTTESEGNFAEDEESAEDDDDEDSDDDDAFDTIRQQQAPGATYINMTNSGRVMRTTSNGDEESVSSVPRTSLPSTSQAKSLLETSLEDEAPEDYTSDANDASYLLPPPDADDYEPATPPKADPIHDDFAQLRARFNSKGNETSPAFSQENDKENVAIQPRKSTNKIQITETVNGTPTKKSGSTSAGRGRPKTREDQPDSHHRRNYTGNPNRSTKERKAKNQPKPLSAELLAEEEAFARRASAQKEAPPPPLQQPVQLIPTNSQLMKAYDFVGDPSIPPLPPPPQEFVQSPTDERHLDSQQYSPNTSYEDDIEQQQQEAQEAQEQPSDASPKSRYESRRQGAKAGLFTIFSPRDDAKTNNQNNDNKTKDTTNGTPETGMLSPCTDHGGDFSRRQLFDNEGDDSVRFRGQNYAVNQKNSSYQTRRQKRRKRLWCAIISLLCVVVLAAAGVIGYALWVKYNQQQQVTAAEEDAVLDLAGTSDAESGDSLNPQDQEASDVVVIAVTNETNATNVEWVVTSPPYNASDLRPVTNKRPTSSPTESPTPSPTVTASPTATPTAKPSLRPTQNPTRFPTQPPLPTAPPTTEGDLAGRLQTLLQSLDYETTESNGQPQFANFVFDFSTGANLMNDPSHQALVYLANEVSAVRGLPDEATWKAQQQDANTEPTQFPDFADDDEGPELGNVVVTVGGGDLPPPPPEVTNPGFYPILVNDYTDAKLLQRFALLTIRSALRANNRPGLVTGAMTRIVVPEELAEAAKESAASSSNNNNNGDATGPTFASATTTTVTDPATLQDPNDARFLVDECDWEGVTCEIPANSTLTTPVVTKISWADQGLDGGLAPALGLLTHLVHLDLSHNELVGSIPEALYDLVDLEEVYLYQNSLTGTLSTLVGRLDKLRRFHLSHNGLTGTLPAELKSDAGSVNGIRPIEYFNVYSNQFTGTIPDELRWRRCTHFDVGRNQLTGFLPEDLGTRFVDLRHLFLDHNQFSGTLPRSYNTVGNGRLVALAIDHNRLTGVLPGAGKEDYDNLVQFTMHENLFRSIEPETCNNHLLVEFKADCPNACTCFGRFFDFCERWCGYPPYGNAPSPGRNPAFDSNPSVGWSQNNNQQWGSETVWGRPPRWQQQPPPSRNWAF